MNDERYTPDFKNDETPQATTSPEFKANNEQRTQETQAYSNAENSTIAPPTAPDSVPKSTPEESAETNYDNHSAGTSSVSSEKPSINMHYKPRKTPTWLVILLCTITALNLILSAAIILLRNSDESPKSIDSSNNISESSSIEDSKPFSDEKPIEEHLQIRESQKSLGAKTTDGALTVKQISEKVRPSVVGVTGQNPSNFSSSSVGSGIIMSSDGYIITNNHVIEGMRKIQVVLDDGTTYDASLIGSDARTDLAVIKIDATGLNAAEFGDSEKLEQGDPAIAIGNPAGLQLQNTVTYGIISAINRDIVVEDRTMTLIQTDASINPGNSGGPLVNEYGQVIGINTIKVGISYYEGLGFAIPMNTAKPIIDELISRGYIKGRPSIGITGVTITERDSAYYQLPVGLYIEYVHPYSDAYKKGLRRGDVITHMNGTQLSSTSEIKQIRDNFKAGDSVTLTIYRNAKEIDIDVILMDEAILSNTEGFQS